MSKRPGDPGYAPGWCIHFRSMGEFDSCEAGVSYDSFESKKSAHRPCFLPHGPGVQECKHFRGPTAEEVAAHEGWRKGRMDLLRTVMVGIKPWRDAHRGRSAAEVVECPACKGRLHLSISSYNGHVHGQCETEGCVRWME